jgi:hypothetical protein
MTQFPQYVKEILKWNTSVVSVRERLKASLETSQCHHRSHNVWLVHKSGPTWSEAEVCQNRGTDTKVLQFNITNGRCQNLGHKIYRYIPVSDTCVCTTAGTQNPIQSAHKCFYAFRMIFTTNRDCFLSQH